MKVISSLLLVLLCSALGYGQEPPKEQAKPDAGKSALAEFHGPKKRAIVTGVDVKVAGLSTAAAAPSGGTTSLIVDLPSPSDFGTGLAEMLETELTASKRFILLERINYDDVLKEHQLSNSPDANVNTSIQAGQVLGAQVIIRGALVDFSYRKETSDAGFGVIGDQTGLGKTKYTATVGLELRMIDVATGRILDSVHAEGKTVSKADNIQINALNLQLGKTTMETNPMGKAIRAAIKDGVKQICNRTETIPWQAAIAAFDDEDGKPVIYLNVGEDSGLTKDMVLDVFHQGKPIIDPETQVQIGRTRDSKLGTIRVVSFEGKTTKVVLVSGGPFAVADVVRVPIP